MKIYTKTGDKGTTSLYGGTKVDKDNLRIETYGTIDELNSYIGLIRSYPVNLLLMEELIIIQKDLFNIGAWTSEKSPALTAETVNNTKENNNILNINFFFDIKLDHLKKIGYINLLILNLSIYIYIGIGLILALGVQKK